MFKYIIKYNVYTPDHAPQEYVSTEETRTHMDEQGLKKILETKHGAQITLISWKENAQVPEHD